MLNQLVLVGRLSKEIEVKENNKGEKEGTITIACPRSFKNEEGNYDTDFVECKVSGTIVESAETYLKKGDIVGIKGRVQSYIENDVNKMEFVGEKLTFLSSHKEDK